MNTVLSISKNLEKTKDMPEIVRTLTEECRNCSPLSPLECVTRCNVWKLKNEFRRLRGIFENPHFTKDLLNAIKNSTRLNILMIISNNRSSLSQLQKELRRIGHSSSKNTIKDEYILPLIEVGLAIETHGNYSATQFGNKLFEMLDSFPEFVHVLPTRSEGYEERLLLQLLSGPKTFQEIDNLFAEGMLARILRRLKKTDLIETPKERDYVFFFKSRRDPNKETFFETERHVYNNIAAKGSSVKELSEKTGLSNRQIYKYLRKLKGKKLIFTRKQPKTYRLTKKGEKLALILMKMQNLVETTWNSSVEILDAEKINTPQQTQ